MRRYCDLHTHSAASDGALSPADLIALADRERLAGVALTDHDTTAGLVEAARAAERTEGVTFIPGVEISAAFPQGTLHILGLGVDSANEAMAVVMAGLLAARNRRNPLMIAKLQRLGIEVTMDEVLAAAGGARAGGRVVSRMHMAAVLTRKGYVRNTTEAFNRYLAAGAPAHVEKERMQPAEAIDAIHVAGGLAVLAHPVHLQFATFAECERLVRVLIDAGLDGVEVYHSDHSDAQTRFLLDLARRLDLAVTGGSDFHGSTKPNVRLGRPRVPVSIMEGLLDRLAARKAPAAE